MLEVDGTLLHSQKKGEDNFEANLGIMYSGKELESKKAKHRRYRLKEKVIYGGIEGADDFGERLYLKGEEKLSLSLASGHLLASKGATPLFDASAFYQWWLNSSSLTFRQPRLIP